MHKRIIVIYILCLSLAASGYAQEDLTITKRQKGLRFTVPEDWPIEERGGVVAPIPIEEYISIKFKDIYAQIDSIKQDLSKKLEDVNLVIEDFQSDTADEFKKFETNLESAKIDVADLTLRLDKITVSLNLIEKDLATFSETIDTIKNQNDNIVKLYKDLVARIEILEQEVEDIRYLSSGEETESWY